MQTDKISLLDDEAIAAAFSKFYPYHSIPAAKDFRDLLTKAVVRAMAGRYSDRMITYVAGELSLIGYNLRATDLGRDFVMAHLYNEPPEVSDVPVIGFPRP